MSNFLQLKRLIEQLANKQGIEYNDLEFYHKLSIINTLMFINTKMIAEVFLKYINRLGVNDERSRLIKMDNEYYFSRLMLTRNKKNYAGIIKAEEGHLINSGKGKLDMKGLAIRKVNTNPKAREFFEEILLEDILKPKVINPTKIVKKYRDFKLDILKDIKSGSAQFNSPGKANSVESYKDPFRIASFRGAILWNKLFPEEEIVFPSRVKMIKLKIDSLEHVQQHVTDERLLNIFEEVFNDENMLVGGIINTISLPESYEVIPDFLIPFVDIDSIVNSTIKPGLILLESLGVRLITSSKASYPSTIITL